MRRKQGVSLGTTLMVVSIVAMLGLALAASNITHLGLMVRSNNATLALDQARSAVDIALAHLYTDKAYGTNSETVTSQGPDQSAGWVTFDSAEAARLGVSLSLNNLSQNGSNLAPDGQVVPQQGAYLVGVGKANGVTRTVRAVVFLPPYPYAASSDGAIVSLGNLVVGSLQAGQSAATAADQLQPADIASNDGSGQAIDLGPGSTIQGSLRAVGGVQVAPGTVVGGKRLTGQAPLKVPDMQVDSYDPQTLGQLSSTLQASYPQSATFTGAVRRDGNVSVTGDLALTQALVFVKGDLTISGSVTGEGILVATGDITIGGQTQMQSNNRVAMLSKGKITLAGSGPASSTLRGLVYAENGVSSQQLSVQGAVVARNPQPVQMTDTRLLGDGALLQAPFDIRPNPPVTDPPTFLLGGGSLLDASGPSAGAHITDSARAAALANGESSYDIIEVRITPNADGTFALSYETTTHSSSGPPTVSPTATYTHLWPNELELALTTGRDPAPGVTALPALGVKPTDLPSVDPVPYDPGSAGPGPGIFQLSADPSQLLPLEDRARVLLWRED